MKDSGYSRFLDVSVPVCGVNRVALAVSRDVLLKIVDALFIAGKAVGFLVPVRCRVGTCSKDFF